MKESIGNIRTLLQGRNAADLSGDVATRAAFERFLEILSEASRYVPDDWKEQAGPDLPWRNVSDLGNALRHAYHGINALRLWSIYSDDLDPLEAAVDAMLAAHGDPE